VNKATIFILFSFFLWIDIAQAERIKIVTSIAPLLDFTKEVGQEKVDVHLLLPPGASPHVFEPTPKSIQKISDAEIFIKIGAGLEFWAEKFVEASAHKELLVVNSSSGISLIRNPHAHGIFSNNPHIWLNPLNAATIVSKIEKALCNIDPGNADFYKLNASVYRDKLIQLDREISERVSALRIKEYVTFHPAWEYFSKRYGLKIAGVIEEAPGKEPSPKHIIHIVREIKRIGSMVIFIEPQFNPKIAEVIAQESGARVVSLDPIGGVTGRKTYIDMMRYNISAIESAMK
jgi:zinc transport system substrate-binding protein